MKKRLVGPLEAVKSIFNIFRNKSIDCKQMLQFNDPNVTQSLWKEVVVYQHKIFGKL